MTPLVRALSGRAAAWAAVAAYAAFIFWTSSLTPRVRLDPVLLKFRIDWSAHVLEYGLFGVLLARAFALTWAGAKGRGLVLAVVAVGALYGATDEYHQSFVPGREPDPTDLCADAVGLAAGAFFWNKRKGSHA